MEPLRWWPPTHESPGDERKERPHLSIVIELRLEPSPRPSAELRVRVEASEDRPPQ